MHAATQPAQSLLSGPRPGPALQSSGYRRREPENTLLHQTVRAHGNTLLAEVAQRTDGGSLPGFVRAEFERYLECGILANGFARVHCGTCGEERLDICSCATAQQERAFIQEQLRNGRSEAEAAEAVNKKYGGLKS